MLALLAGQGLRAAEHSLRLSAWNANRKSQQFVQHSPRHRGGMPESPKGHLCLASLAWVDGHQRLRNLLGRSHLV